MRFQLPSLLLLLASTGLSSAEEKYTVAVCRDGSEEAAPGTGNTPIIYGQEAQKICEAINATFCGDDSCVVQLGNQVDEYKKSCEQAGSHYKAQIYDGSKTLKEAKEEAFCS
jgi:hypothetical protein